VEFQKLVPGAVAALRCRVQAVFAEDVSNGPSRRRSDSQLLEFADDASVAPAGILASHAEDQFSQVSCCPLAVSLDGRSAGGLAFANPAPQRVRVDDRRKLIERSAKFFGEPNLPALLFGDHGHSRRQFAP